MLKGKQAKEVLSKILSDANGSPYGKPYISGYFPDVIESTKQNVFTAFDNTTADCWVESFPSDKEAEKWCLEANPHSPIIVKQLLDHIDYGTLFELWDEHVHQLSDPPETYELINQLSDLIDVDADVAAAVSDKICKEDEPTAKILPVCPIIKSLLSHCVNYTENILPLRPDVSGNPDGTYYLYDETYNVFLENVHNEIEQYFKSLGYFS